LGFVCSVVGDQQEPHVDRCASAWLIKCFIDKDETFKFLTRERGVPEGAIGFTLPKAEISPVEGVKTTFDSLVEKHHVKDVVVLRTKGILGDYEFNEENSERTRLRKLGVCYILKGLEKTSRTNAATVSKTIVVMDALYAALKELGK